MDSKLMWAKNQWAASVSSSHPETDMGRRKINIYYLNNAILKYMDVDKYDNEIENNCKYTIYTSTYLQINK